MNKEFIKALFALDKVCHANNISYVLTGTMALMVHGISVMPHDIDIAPLNALTEEQKATLRQLQILSGCKTNPEYHSENYTFRVHDITVNVLVGGEREGTFALMNFWSNQDNRSVPINVQLVESAILDKMTLNRPKDMAFMISFINRLTSIALGASHNLPSNS